MIRNGGRTITAHTSVVTPMQSVDLLYGPVSDEVPIAESPNKTPDMAPQGTGNSMLSKSNPPQVGDSSDDDEPESGINRQSHDNSSHSLNPAASRAPVRSTQDDQSEEINQPASHTPLLSPQQQGTDYLSNQPPAPSPSHTPLLSPQQQHTDNLSDQHPAPSSSQTDHNQSQARQPAPSTGNQENASRSAARTSATLQRANTKIHISFQVGASPVELSTDTTKTQHVNKVLANQ